MQTFVARAFNFAREHYRNDIPAGVAQYVSECAPDRRYRVKWHAATSDYRSAIVSYRGVRYYADHDYVSDTYSATRRSNHF